MRLRDSASAELYGVWLSKSLLQDFASLRRNTAQIGTFRTKSPLLLTVLGHLQPPARPRCRF